MHKLEAEGITPRAVTEEDLARLTAPEEVELIRRLAQFPMELVDAARAYDPARITRYSTDIATLFHKFYNACKVIGDDEPLMPGPDRPLPGDADHPPQRGWPSSASPRRSRCK